MPGPSDSIDIVECKTKAERRQFIEFQWEVYKGDPYWVPPLVSERESFWDKTKNPFYKHSDAAMFMARRGGKVVGTIAAVQNNRHNEFHNEKTGFFGGFEVVRDYDVAARLFDTAKAWVAARGLTTLRGPATVSLNDECGMLVDAFDAEPMVLMTYNPRYYPEFVERYGFKKAMDLMAWWDPIEHAIEATSGKFARVVELAKKRGKFSIRPLDFSRFDQEVEAVKSIYTSEAGAWQDNWGHVPMTDEEVRHIVGGLKQFADPDFVLVAEMDGRPVGLALSLPNVNRPLRKAYPNPRTPELITLGKFVWYRRKMVDAIRIVALGVLKEHRMAGVDAVLIWETMQAVIRKGYRGGEFSWVLETNETMNRICRLGGGEVYKTYRMYDLPI